MTWDRVTRDHPCPICGKPDWCLVAPDGQAAICARIASARKAGQAGWLHRLSDESIPARRPVVLRAVDRIPDFTDLARECAARVTPGGLARLAHDLGVTVESLTAFQVGWSADHQAWTFPMRDPILRRVTGLRLRKPDGDKLSVKGGREALFLSIDFPRGPVEQLVICEGALDALAACSLGLFNAVGRPSCRGGMSHLVALVRATRPAQIVLVADDDGPGLAGARDLAARLALYCRDTRTITPPRPFKDLRAWLQAGASPAELAERIHAASPSQVNITLRTA